MERLGIAKLNGSNYSTWKQKVEFLLIREDLWKFVKPVPVPAAAGSSAATVSTQAETQAVTQASTTGDQKARANIGLLLEDSQLSLIKNCATAKATWEALQSHYEKSTLDVQVSILIKLCDKKYIEGEDIEQHVFEMEELFERLAEAGQPWKPSFQVTMLLRSLPESFRTLSTVLGGRPVDELTLELVRSKLVDEVAKRGPTASGSGESALKADAGKKSIVCSFCDKPGHKQRQCRARMQQQQSKSGERSEKQYKSKAKAARQDDSSAEFNFLVLKQEVERDVWIIDSGATSHMCIDPGYFTTLDKSVQQAVYLADGKRITTQGVGTCKLFWASPDGGRNTVTLSDVMYAPQFDTNLISVKKLAAKGVTVVFDADGCRILKDERVIGDTTMSGGLYKLRTVHEARRVSETKHNPNCIHSWHRILGHRDPDAIRDLENKELATGIQIQDCGCKVTCECCVEGKFARLPFPKQSKSESRMPLDLIHSDVCGPLNTPTPKGCRYFVTLIDDYSRYTVVYFLRQKSEVTERIKDYVRFVKTLFGRTPKVIRSDQGGEYQNEALDRFCRQEGIRQQFTTAYTPQQNGVSERKNRSLMEMARCMILDAKLTYKYWTDAVHTATYLQNRLRTKPVLKTPYELWTGEKPDLSHFKVFGSWAHVKIPAEKRSKLDAKSKKLLFVGYSLQHKAYRFVDPETHKLTVSRDCRFMTHREVRETEPLQGSIVSYPFTKCPEKSDEADEVPTVTELECDDVDDGTTSEAEVSGFETATSETDDDSDDTILPDDDDAAEAATEGQEELGGSSSVRRSTRATKGVQPQRFGNTVNLTVQEYQEPRSFAEAMKSPDRDLWKRAMEEEIQSLHENATWEVVPASEDRKPIGCKWVFKRKLDSNGEVTRYKARLVAQGFSQKYGTDYDEVFAPVAKQTTFRTLLSIASRRKLLVKHVDVKSAYLYGELDETIYMRQPIGFETGAKSDVCLLRKSLYGLKQAGRVWNRRITDILKNLGYKPSEADPCLFVRVKRADLSFVLLYVDDMLIACRCEEEYKRVKTTLSKSFKITCLGDVSHYLGIRIQRGHDGRFKLDQASYIHTIASRFGQENAKPSHIPMDPGYPKIQKEEEKLLPRNDEFQSLVGALLYIAVNTRPDIAISTSILGRKVSNPTQADWTEAKRTLRYLKSTADLKLELGGPGQLEAYVDADWAGDYQDRKSNSGFIFSLGGSISWAARKQKCVTLSSTEAEYVAMAEACQEFLWLQKLMKDIGEKPDGPIKLNEDNQSCIAMLHSEGGSRRTKHIDTRFNFIRDLANTKIIEVRYCPTELMTADVLTKPLSRVKLETFRKKMGLQSP